MSSRPRFGASAAQVFHFFAVMLWIAGLLAIAAGMTYLGFAIFGVVVVNSAFAHFQEQRADRTAKHLEPLARVLGQSPPPTDGWLPYSPLPR